MIELAAHGDLLKSIICKLVHVFIGVFYLFSLAFSQDSADENVQDEQISKV